MSKSTSAACGLHRGHTRAKHYGFYLQIYRIPTVHLKQSLPLHQATEEELRGLVHNQQRERGGSASQCITPSVQDNKGAMSPSGDSPMSLVDGRLMQPPGSPRLCPSSSSVVMHRRQAFPPLKHFAVSQSSTLLTTGAPDVPIPAAWTQECTRITTFSAGRQPSPQHPLREPDVSKQQL